MEELDPHLASNVDVVHRVEDLQASLSSIREVVQFNVERVQTENKQHSDKTVQSRYFKIRRNGFIEDIDFAR